MRWLPAVLCFVCLAPGLRAGEWIELVGEKAGDVWKGPVNRWLSVSGVKLDAKNERRLEPLPGKGVLLNGPKGRERDLITRESFGDLELEMEFCIPKRSNSGVKFHAVYEIQIQDSHGKPKEKLTGDDCGGVYPRAELKPRYRQLDKGVAPRANACKPPGEWQKLHAIFLAPRFDAAGKKIANARLVKVVLNDVVIHEDVELKTPTGSNWTQKEVARGPLLLQGDHGPVAFRHVRVRPYTPGK